MHHGNGTEEGFEASDNLFYGSTHEQDNYPGTGREPKHLGSDAKEIHRRIVNRYLTAGPESKNQFRVKWQQIIDEMKRFSPGMVIISAGFDAHVDDPLGGCELDESDFAWATKIVLDACIEIGQSTPVPCISILEGGYNLAAISRSAVEHCRVLSAWANLIPEYSAVGQLSETVKNIVVEPQDLTETFHTVPKLNSHDEKETSSNVSAEFKLEKIIETGEKLIPQSVFNVNTVLIDEEPTLRPVPEEALQLQQLCSEFDSQLSIS